MILTIKNLNVSASLGVFEWEKQSKRSVVFNMVIYFDGARASITDDISDSVDYAKVEQLIIEIANARHYQLIEALVAEIGGKLLKEFPRIKEITVEASKPGALRQAETVSIAEVFRR
nr:Dihydroneopterin aldolase [uncultured bacterium]